MSRSTPSKKNTSWGKVADWYNTHLQGNADTYHSKVILPNLLRVMQIQKGEVVLDLGCGQGFFSRAFYDSGARVIAADIATELIELAKQQSSTEIQFHAAPADQIGFLSDASVDKITIILAIQNIENVRGVITECARVLKPGGRVYLVLNHPAFRIPKRSSWGWDTEANVQYRRMDGYLSESRHEIEMHPGKEEKKPTISFHRPLQYYFKEFSKHGLAVTRLEEWISHKQSQQGPRAYVEDVARKEFPLFLFLEARK